VDVWPHVVLGRSFPLLSGGHCSLIRHLLVFSHSSLFFRCLLVHDGAALRTTETSADPSRLRLVSQSLFLYGGGAARAAPTGGPLAASPPRFPPEVGEAAPSPPLGGVGGGRGLFLPFEQTAIGRPVTAATSIAVRALLVGGVGGAHPLGGQGQGRAHPRLPQG